MVVSEGAINNIMSGMENTAGVRLHSHRHKLKQRFDIIRKLGQGTYGKVQLAINKETGQEVAIKTIKKGKIETEQDLVRIRREIQIMSSVQHPQIIHIYEVFENREKMVLVMEYAAGGELYDYLSERKVLLEDEARRVFRQVSSAVYYCHKHKICHRDLKLENILLDFEGNAKIADFGLSNVFDDKRNLDTFCGSPLYASPEIVKGIPYLGPEVDCWSLGVLLYTLVYGAMPFDGSNFRRLVKQITQGDFYEPATPSSASELIKHMLTIKPDERATIEDICNHKWVNKNFKTSCYTEAEVLANETPVRLDLLLSLAPKQIDSEHMLIQPEDPIDDSKKSTISGSSDVNSTTDQNAKANTDEKGDPCSDQVEVASANTTEAMNKQTKTKKHGRSTENANEISPTPEKKKKSSLAKSSAPTKKKSNQRSESRATDTKSIDNLEKSDSTKMKEKEKLVSEKKKLKKKDSSEMKGERKKSKSKSTESFSLEPNATPPSKAVDEKIKQESPNRTVDPPKRAFSPKGKITDEIPEEIIKDEIIPNERSSPRLAKPPLDDTHNTEDILIETAAKIKAVEAATDTEILPTSPKKLKPKPDYTIGSPVSNKSSNHSSSVTSPTRSRTGSESSGDRSTSRRHSKIFSKAAMFDNLAAQSSSGFTSPEKTKRTPKPGILNLSDLTKKFEDISATEKKNKSITPLKTSDTKRPSENKSDKLQNSSRASSKSSDSQRTSPTSKLNSQQPVTRREAYPRTNDEEKETGKKASSKNVTKANTQDLISKSNEPVMNKYKSPNISSTSVNNKNSTPDTKTRVSPHKTDVKFNNTDDAHLTRHVSRPRVQKEKVGAATRSQESISNKNSSATNSSSRIRQIEIKLESSDSSDSESEAEKMLKTLTEKREKLEQAKAEKMKLVIDVKDNEPKRDMPAIKEESRTPTPARHVLAAEIASRIGNNSPLSGDIKTKDSAFPRKSEPLMQSNNYDDNARKKTQIQITLNPSKQHFESSEASINRSSSRSSPDYTSIATGNPSVVGGSEGERRHLQRARRERIIPIMLEDDDSFQQTSNTSRTSSSTSVPMYSASTRAASSVTPQWQNASKNSGLIHKSRQERVIPIALEDEGTYVPMTPIQLEGNIRKPMYSTTRHGYRHGMSMIDRSDSFSSAGEDDDDDDGFQILTAESLFSTLLSRVRSLTRKMNDDPRYLQRTDDRRLTPMSESDVFLSRINSPADNLQTSRTSTSNAYYHDDYSMGNRDYRSSEGQSDEESVSSMPSRKCGSLPRGQKNADQMI